MESIAVLIIGAGPTGLTLALALNRRGVPVRIVDQSAERSDQSRALGVHSGTLEIFESLIGESLPRAMVELGNPVQEILLHVGAAAPVRIDASTFPSRYNFILVLEQSQTERLLEEELGRRGVQVERAMQFVGLTEASDHVRSKLRDARDRETEVRSSFVAGCDGAHSPVRESLRIPFDGGTYPGHSVLADVRVRADWGQGTVRTFLNEHGAMGVFPYRASGQFRIVVVPRSPQGAIFSEQPGLDELQAWVDRAIPGGARLESTSWISKFRVHRRVARDFGRGRVLLAGDAAHIHSPVGGQGMNIGIQDALNLSVKLSAALTATSPDVLRAYQQERKPIAQRTALATGLAYRLAILRAGVLLAILLRVLPRVARVAWVQRRMGWAISEVGVARRELGRFQT